MKNIIIFSFVSIIALVSQSFKQTNPATTSLKNGKQAYETYCQSCHMEDGQGVPGAFPTLVKAGNLNDKNRLVKIILQGMRGSITTKGVKYDAEMTGIDMSEKETADLINYIRNTWGNKAPMIGVADVATAKKAVVKGYQPY